MKISSAYFAIDFSNDVTGDAVTCIDKSSASHQEAEDRAHRWLWKTHGPRAVTEQGWKQVGSRYVSGLELEQEQRPELASCVEV